MNINNYEDFFGTFYAKNYKSFKFLPGHKIFIKALVKHVKDTVEKGENNSMCEHFNPKSSSVPIPPITQSTEDTKNVQSYFLKLLQSNAESNANRKKEGFRYDKQTHAISAYLRMICGTLGYHTFQANLQRSMPSITSVNRYIRASHFHITEGILRSEELQKYLNDRSLPKVVSLSEDATRVVGKVQYCSITNQIVGFTLPINHKIGMPVPFAYPARNADEIMKHFEYGNSSSFLNIIMAQPVVKNESPFCLLLFGSDSKYSANDVKNRWKFIVRELAKIGIKTLTISSDSDPRYNSAMRELSKLGMKSNINWFSCSVNISTPIYIQDTVHILTKLRNFFLRTKAKQKKLPFGDYSIDMMHLYVLLYTFPKDHHQLTESVLNPTDKQNFSSAERMCDIKVTALLDFGVERSKATSLYLKIMNHVLRAFLDTNLSPIERIRSMWFSVFIFRIWRHFIESHKNYTLKDNFLSMNCYSCIELNAHGLILLIIHLRDTDQQEMFLPELFGSQQCESTFRQFRSMTSTYSTVVNCTVKESAARISKIQLQNEIMHTLSKNFVFPRLKHQSNTSDQRHFELPSNEEIFAEVENCQKNAIDTAKQFGLITQRSKKIYTCEINQLQSKKITTNPMLDSKPKVQYQYARLNLNNIKLKDYSGILKEAAADITSPYVTVQGDNGIQTIVKKTSLVWLLREDCQKLSSDRLVRVRHAVKKAILQADRTAKQKKVTTKKSKINKRLLLRFKKRPIQE